VRSYLIYLQGSTAKVGSLLKSPEQNNWAQNDVSLGLRILVPSRYLLSIPSTSCRILHDLGRASLNYRHFGGVFTAYLLLVARGSAKRWSTNSGGDICLSVLTCRRRPHAAGRQTSPLTFNIQLLRTNLILDSSRHGICSSWSSSVDDLGISMSLQ
jgi:hypothetical protein